MVKKIKVKSYSKTKQKKHSYIPIVYDKKTKTEHLLGSHGKHVIIKVYSHSNVIPATIAWLKARKQDKRFIVKKGIRVD